jgi:ferredoxin
MKCLSCGHCCKMSPINSGYCPLLIEAKGNHGTIYYCSDYENRPIECKNHTYPASICPVGLNTLSLINDSLIKNRLTDISNTIPNYQA